MNSDKDLALESDSSDEDFCPDAGENSSDDEVESDDAEDVEDVEDQPNKLKRPAKAATKTKAGTSTRNDVEMKRSTRHSREIGNKKGDSATRKEKEDIESDEDEKARSDALWADFLGDVKHTSVEVKKTESVPTTLKVTSNREAVSKFKELDEEPKKITVTKILDFAGEEIRVEKTISADSVKENKTEASKNPLVNISGGGFVAGVKRTAASSSSGSGLGSLLNQIGKKKKISVLEKTKMDWNSFKKDEGIEEQLQTFNKGKDGFLERQDFLERTDLRQFEIERNMRQTRRNH